MTRRNSILAVLSAVLVVALTWVLLYQPKNEEVAELQAATVAAEARGEELAIRVGELQAVRENAPEAAAQLVAGTAIIPREPSLPAMLRQVQMSADDAGVTLKAMAPGRPEPVTIEGAGEGLARMGLVVDAEGEYFQLVDFLRRLEDPLISPRGVLWKGAIVDSEYDVYPTLSVSMQGEIFAIMPVISPDPAEDPSAATEDDDPEVDNDAEDGVDTDDTVEVDS